MDARDASDLGPGLGLDAPPPSKGGEAYRVLARKYRPKDFTGLIGQEALVKTLSNAFASGRIAHAFMLTGVRGVGKTTTARIIARALNCVGPDASRKTPTVDPCGVCEPCIAIAESRFIDVQEMDAASRTGIEDIREIIEGTRYAPAAARYKVYIIDEVHMLSKNAFNGLLKTLEEPPPHVKFVFATTEIRKVPVTVLSRCQRFDLRRIETEMLARHLDGIARKENVAIDAAALSLIARAAEGSVRDGVSLLDQAMAHHAGEGGAIAADSVRAMLGLADRSVVLDLFEKLMTGDIAVALTILRGLYDKGADPLVVMQDLLEITHFLTRVNVAPAAEGFFDGGSSEAARAAAMAGKLTVPALARAWQILLKGLIEVRDAANALPAAEMALIRLAYAAELPPAERLVRTLMEAGPAQPQAQPSPPAAPGGGAPPRAQASMRSGETTSPLALAQPSPVMVASGPELRTLEDVVALAKAKGARVLERLLENDVHLVAMDKGRIEFRPGSRAPKTLASDLGQRLKDWTGERWIISVASEGGAPTIAESRLRAEQARKDAVSQQPFVRAVLDAFPGADIVAVRDKEELPPPAPNGEEPA
jgi:DNA polymerase III subunit gamma/tau